MHSVLQDEWEEANPGVGERVGVQYLGQRSGDTYDYHMWTVKVDRKANAGEDAPQASDTAGSDRAPQESGAGDFDGSDLWGKPALDTESREEAPQESSGGDSAEGSTLDDPNGGLPF